MQEIYEANVDTLDRRVNGSTGKRNVLGVLVDAVDYEAAVDRDPRRPPARGEPYARDRARRARRHDRGAGHARTAPGSTPSTWSRPDGQPVRWALNLLHRTALAASYGAPTSPSRVLAGGRAERPAGLLLRQHGRRRSNALRRHSVAAVPGAARSPAPSRRSSGAVAGRDAEDDRRGFATSGAAIVFVGLGCPRQESLRVRDAASWSACRCSPSARRSTTTRARCASRRGVAAALGLEWLWRLGLEPRRLWRRYVLLNPAYLGLLALQAVGLHRPVPLTGESSRIRNSTRK